MALMFAICSPQPNWMPRKPKLMFQICQKLRRGLSMAILPLVLAPALALHAPVVLRHLPQPPAYLRGEGAGRETPPPVAARPRGYVHAGLAAEAEDSLQRDDRQLGHRSQQRADEAPVDLPT